MIGRLNHIGIATPSLEEGVKFYRDLLGATNISAPMKLSAHGVRVCFIEVENSQIELVEPLGEDSPVAAFLKRNPKGGQHHMCFEVADVVAARDQLVAQGATVLNHGEPKIGSHGVPVIFLHPKDTGGVLIELMAEPGKAASHDTDSHDTRKAA